MKPEKFDGCSSFETIIYMFENCCKYNRWDEEDKVAHLRWSLTGIAAQLLWDTENLTYRQLVERLRDRFGGKGMEDNSKRSCVAADVPKENLSENWPRTYDVLCPLPTQVKSLG